MTVTYVACAPWRIAWAERENERRQRAYRDATDAWLHRDDHLVRLRIEAASFLGCTQPRTGLPVDLYDDELVFRVLPVATLVEAEARHVPGLPTPGPCDLADTADEVLPAGLRAVGTGMAVVTSHRVAFAGGGRRREWRYADLLGMAHHPDVPVTLLHDNCRLAGLLVPASAAVNFRFYLTLAATEDRAAVTGQVDALLAAHRATPPEPLPTVAPADAPLSAVRPDRRALAVAAVATVVFAMLGPGAVGPPQAGPLRRAEAATIVPVRNSAVIGPLRAPAILAPPNPAMPTRPAEPARPPKAGPVRPAAPAVAVAVPLPTSAPVPSTVSVPLSVPVPSVAPGPSVSVTPTPTPAPTDPATAAGPVVSPPTPTAQAATTTPNPATPSP
ncbi:hypothetical protein AB0B86_28750 [Micromonospora sp. NPDC049047]|uniref:hypothetical protein n=1 Tax=Micromonospora sp. NPDC049047 TaxID=3155645 RepID=UPI0033EA6E6B